MRGRVLMASSMSRRGARDGWKRWSRRRGAEWPLKPERDRLLRAGHAVPEWRSREFSYDREWAATGCCARRCDNGLRARPGRLVKRSRSGRLMGGNLAHLEYQDIRDGQTLMRRGESRVCGPLLSGVSSVVGYLRFRSSCGLDRHHSAQVFHLRSSSVELG